MDDISSLDHTSSQPPPDGAPKGKTPVVRGARACTVCRAAKMRCIGAEDGQKQCQRCKRANVECIFEKHRRGRKPGSKLSEASKMLRRLEKGINNAKLKAQASASSMPFPVSDSRSGAADTPFHLARRSGDSYMEAASASSRGYPPYAGSSTSSNEFPPLAMPPYNHSYSSTADRTLTSPSQTMEAEEEEDDELDKEDGLYPSRLLAKENQRQSFFRTILNPPDPAGQGATKPEPDRRDGVEASKPPTSSVRTTPAANGLDDPISAGLIDEAEAKVLFDLVFLRLNPFINLFDPVLHTVPYVRGRCPFLFSVLILAGTKFWKPELFKQCQKIAYDFAVRAFAEGWKRVEVVQAFACLTYWKEPDDTRTWTYIGYACRMAVELGLNRYCAKPIEGETEMEKRERRNRERTYLVLFVHDRSLSMQTGRQWMLPEDDLVRHSHTWHEDSFMRPEDVIVAAFVQLRRIAAETTDVFYLHKGVPGAHHADVNYEILLRGCNSKLTAWMDTWQNEMKRAGGQLFHFSMLCFFRLHVRLFLNSFGLQSSMSSQSKTTPSLQALSACYTSALQTLQIVTKEFAPVGMLRYGQESITVMTAYSAVFLLKLLRRTTTLTELNEGASQKIYDLISQTADAYQEAAILAASSSSAAYHARFLRSLVAKDTMRLEKEKRAREAEELRRNGGRPNDQQHSQSSYNQQSPNGPYRPPDHPPPSNAQGQPGSPPLPVHAGPQNGPSSHGQNGSTPPNNLIFQQQPVGSSQPEHTWHFPASPHLPAHPLVSPGELPGDPFGPGANGSGQQYNQSGGGQGAANGNFGQVYPGTTEMDRNYWHNMFRELGFGGSIEPTVTNDPMNFDEIPPQGAFGPSNSMGMIP